MKDLCKGVKYKICMGRVVCHGISYKLRSLKSVDLDTILNFSDSCEGKTSLLEQIIRTFLDQVMPMRTRNVHFIESAWITSTSKNLIQKRQSALLHGDDQVFRELRNRVHRKRKMCRAKYNQAKVEHRKKCDHLSGERTLKTLVDAFLPPRRKVIF